MAVPMRYLDAIVLTAGGGALFGEPHWAIRQAERAGVIYHCSKEDGSCGHGVHRSSGESAFWHYCDGKTDADYDLVTAEHEPGVATY